MRHGSLPIAISAVLAANAFAQPQSPIQLEPEKTFNRNLAAGDTDLFALDLKADQIVQLTLEDQGKDVILSVYSPDGRLSRAFSSERQKGDAPAWDWRRTGIDSAPTAIALAEAKARDRGLTAHFLVDDALQLASLDPAIRHCARLRPVPRP